ncbi:MAG: nitrite/sulfite reductase [Clostridiales bacterium]|nr:nitrite/sulfite reductase [Clostridiales bacterium]
MDRLKEILKSEIKGFREQGYKFLNGELTVPEFKKISGGMGVYAHRGGKEFMVRLRIPSGITNINELNLICNLEKRNDLDFVHLTTRQAIQLHGLSIDNVCDLMEECLDYNIFTRGAGGNFPRNVAIDPLAGTIKGEAFDVSPYALIVGNYFLKEIYNYKLPRKLKVSFSSTSKDEAHCEVQDLGFIPKIKDDKKYFKVYVAGGLGNNPRKAIVLKELIEAKDVLYYVEGLTKLFMEEGDYENKNKARLRYIPIRIGEEEFVKKFQEYVDNEKKNNDLTINIVENETKKERIKTNVTNKRLIEQKQEGLYSVYIHPIGGQLKINDMENLLKLIEEYEDIDIRLSMDEGMYIRNLNGEEAEKVLEFTNSFSGSTDFEYSVSCIGVPICQVGIGNSQGLLQDIFDYFNEKQYISYRLPKIHISGCTNSCGVHEISPIGFFGKKKRINDKVEDVFTLVIGGKLQEDDTRLGENKGDMLKCNIPAFLYDVSLQLDEENMLFEDYIINGNIDKIINKYLV